MASLAIVWNFFEKQWIKNHPQYLSGLSRALIPTTFLEIAVNSGISQTRHANLFLHFWGLRNCPWGLDSRPHVLLTWCLWNLTFLTLDIDVWYIETSSTFLCNVLKFNFSWMKLRSAVLFFGDRVSADGERRKEEPLASKTKKKEGPPDRRLICHLGFFFLNPENLNHVMSKS